MTKERGGSLIFLAAGIYGLIFSIQLPLGRWNEPGPAVFPLGLSILLCIFGISWFIQGKGKGEKKETVGLGGFVRKFITPLQIVGLTAAFILTFELIGVLVGINALSICPFPLGEPLQVMDCPGPCHSLWGRKLALFWKAAYHVVAKGISALMNSFAHRRSE